MSTQTETMKEMKEQIKKMDLKVNEQLQKLNLNFENMFQQNTMIIYFMSLFLLFILILLFYIVYFFHSKH